MILDIELGWETCQWDLSCWWRTDDSNKALSKRDGKTLIGLKHLVGFLHNIFVRVSQDKHEEVGDESLTHVGGTRWEFVRESFIGIYHSPSINFKSLKCCSIFFFFFFSSIFYISRYSSCCGLVMVSGPLPGMKLLVMADRWPSNGRILLTSSLVKILYST